MANMLDGAHAQRWYQLIDTTDEKLCEQVCKKLWPAKSDPDFEPTHELIGKAIAFLAPKADKEPKLLPGKPQLLKTNYCHGDHMVSWTIENGTMVHLSLVVREWYIKPASTDVETHETKDTKEN